MTLLSPLRADGGPASSPRPLRARDRPWGAFRMGLVVGPLTGCDLEGLRVALAGLITTDPHCRALQRVGWVEQTWQPVPPEQARSHAERLARPYDGSAATLDGVCEELLAEPVDDLPFRAVLGPDFLGLRVNHLLGDAGTAEALLTWVGGLAGGAPPTPLPSRAPVPLPFVSAVRATYGRELPARALVDTGRFILRTRAAQRREQPAPAPAERGPISVEAVATGPAGPATLEAWRRRNHRDTGGGTVLIAAAWAALAGAGVLAPGALPWTVIDLRRYLPKGAHVDGNFVNSVRLPAGTACTVPGVRDALQAAVSSGVPLLSAAAQSGLLGARAGLGRAVRAPGAVPVLDVWSGGEAVITVMGRHRSYEALPWVPGAPRRSLEGPTVDTAHGLTFCLSQLDDGYHLTAGFYETGLRRAQVRQALEAFRDDLPGLLERIRDADADV